MIYKYIRVLFACLAFSVMACKNDGKGVLGTSDYYHVDELKEFRVARHSKDTIKGELFLSPEIGAREIGLHDSVLIVMADPSTPLLFHLYNVNTREEVCSFGDTEIDEGGLQHFSIARKIFSIGKAGYGETSYCSLYGIDGMEQYFPDMFYVVESNGRLWLNVHDRITTRFFDLNKTIEQRKGVFTTHRSHDFGKYHFCLNLKGDSSVVMKELSTVGSRFKRYTPPKIFCYAGGKRKDVCIYPNILKDKNIGAFDFMYSALKPRIKPDKTKVVEALCLMDIINVIDVKTGKVLGLKEAGTYNFEDVEKFPRDSTFSERIMSFNQVMQVTDNYIYLLQDRCSEKELNRGNKKRLQTLLILDWKGNLKSQVCLDRNITSMACDEKNSLLYGIASKGQIYRFDLSKCFGAKNKP